MLLWCCNIWLFTFCICQISHLTSISLSLYYSVLSKGMSACLIYTKRYIYIKRCWMMPLCEKTLIDRPISPSRQSFPLCFSSFYRHVYSTALFSWVQQLLIIAQCVKICMSNMYPRKNSLFLFKKSVWYVCVRHTHLHILFCKNRFQSKTKIYEMSEESIDF